jgi:flagellin
MGLRINQNIAALNAYRNLSVSDTQMAKSLEKLSSGYRINRAGDDAAGLVISEGLRAQVTGLKVAVRNAQDGISVVQTAEGALTEVHSLLQRVRELAVQASSTATTSQSARDAIKDEVTEAINEIDRIGGATDFNGTKLLNGSVSALTFQVGASSDTAVDQVVVDLSTATTVGSVGLSLTTVAASIGAGDVAVLDDIDAAIEDVSTLRGKLGAYQNRFEHTIANLNVAVENLAASESRIRDTDMALEMANFTRHQILTQAGTAMLAQANAASQGVLQLLRG